MHEFFKFGKVVLKPTETDGAQDEDPRYTKALTAAISFFKKLDLDVLLHGTNASGLSAFNPVERRMTSLCHDIAGVLLRHDSFGNYQNSS